MNKKLILTSLVILLVFSSGCINPTDTGGFLDNKTKLSGMDISHQNRMAPVLSYEYNASIEVDGQEVADSNGTVNKTSKEAWINDNQEIYFDGENYTVQNNNTSTELNQTRVWTPQRPTEFNLTSYDNATVERKELEPGVLAVVAEVTGKTELEEDVARIVVLKSEVLSSNSEYQLSETNTTYTLPSSGLGINSVEVQGVITQGDTSVRFKYHITYNYRTEEVELGFTQG